MVRTQTISTKYTAYDDAGFLTLGQNIVAGLNGNPHYPAPPQKLDALSDLLEELTQAAHQMKTGLKAATQQRDYLRKQAEADLKGLSAYATSATPNRPDLWATANFPLTKADATPRPPSQPVTGLLLADGPSAHTLQASVDVQPGMYAYVWRVYPRATTAEALATGFCYRSCLSRQPKVLLEGLESGTATWSVPPGTTPAPCSGASP